jgi:hypothetical protein
MNMSVSWARRALGGTVGRWPRRRVAIVSGLTLVAGSILGIVLGGSGTAMVATGAGDSSCNPRSVQPSDQVTDRYDRQVLSLDPSLYLTLGHQPSAIEPDLSGNGHDGVYEPGSDPPRFAALPNGDLATVFNGYDEYVQVSSSASLSITDAGCLTVEAWVMPTVLQFPHNQGGGYVYILGKGITGEQEYALRMYSYSNSETPPRPNRISAYAFNLAGGKGSGAYFQDPVRPGEWIMVAFVIDSRPSARWPNGYIAIYKNGQLRASPVSLAQFNVTPRASDAPFRIGTRDLESFFEGAIGKVAVYNSVLSAQDILATYNAMVSPGGA